MYHAPYAQSSTALTPNATPYAHLGEQDPIVERAKTFAHEIHHGQKRKSGKPFIVHPANVDAILRWAGYEDENLLASAWLHDIWDMSKVPVQFVAQQFNDTVARHVAIVSRDVDRYAYITRILHAPALTQILKLADQIDITSDLENLADTSCKRCIAETKEYYIPLAARIEPTYATLLEYNVHRHKCFQLTNAILQDASPQLRSK